MERYNYLGKVLSITDGDTITLDIDLGCNVHVIERCRLFGIDAPESYGVKKSSDEYKAGIISKEWLQDKIEGKEVIVRTYKDKKGKYGRYLVEIFLEEDSFMSVNEAMVEKGLAVEYDGGKR